VAVDLPGFTAASVYVPNGGKDYEAKLRFLDALGTWAGEFEGAGRALVMCGDMNVARTDLDVHPKERKAGAIGQRPDERALVERILARGLVDVARALAPDDGTIFTWWPPWRRMRERNIGWRIDAVWASTVLATRATSCPAEPAFGTSDHAPLVASFRSGPS
jgi:exodeoxyribonuclease-3